jgi:cytochrome b involved in lipid metabolism
MAALINRLMSGENQFRTNDIRTDNSPLQIFVKAKKKINDIFVEINDYVDDTTRFIRGK